jgi:AcrR family transcriptional regulator
MGILERRSREKEALRSKILEAAGQLIVEEGIQNVSIRRIADRIEYSPSTIYLYFKDKGDLISAICESVFQELSSRLDEIERTASDPLESLRRGLRCYIDFGVEHRNHYLVTFCLPRAKEVESSTHEYERIIACGCRTFDSLRRALKHCVDAGFFYLPDIEATGQALWTQIHGTTSLLITSYGQPGFPWVEREKLIETGLDMILAGLGAEKIVACR